MAAGMINIEALKAAMAHERQERKERIQPLISVVVGNYVRDGKVIDKVEYLSRDTLVSCFGTDALQPLHSIERTQYTEPIDRLVLPDGRTCRIEGDCDEALRLRLELDNAKALLAQAADAISSAADAIEDLDHGDIDGECASSREFAAELREAAGVKPEDSPYLQWRAALPKKDS